MKGFAKILVLGAAMAAATPFASASPITGGIVIGGSDTFTNTSITFNPTTGVVTASSGTLASLAPAFVTSASLTSFTFANSNNVILFSTPNATTPTITFTINGPVTASIDASGTLTIKGTGTFTETGYDATAGSFTLSSSSSGQMIGFSIQSSVSATPEPSSLLLLGTGLLAAAGVVFRKRLSDVAGTIA